MGASPEVVRPVRYDPQASPTGEKYEDWYQKMQENLRAGRDPSDTRDFDARRASVEEIVRGVVRHRRNAIRSAGGFEATPPDVADVALRNAVTGRLGKARRGSGRSAFGMAFDASAPLGTDPFLGRW